MAAQFAKAQAKKLLHKLADSIDAKDNNSNSSSNQTSNGHSQPPPTPPKPSYTGYQASASASQSQPALTTAFSNLNLSGPAPPPPEPHFVGGFHPTYPAPYGSGPGLSAGNPASPPYHPSSTPNLPLSMPSPISSGGGNFPQSLTMQMALQPEEDIRPNFGSSPGSTPSKPKPPKGSNTPGKSSASATKPPRPSLNSQNTASTSGSKDSGTPTKTKPKPKPGKKPRPSKTKPKKDEDDYDDEEDEDDDPDFIEISSNDDEPSPSAVSPSGRTSGSGSGTSTPPDQCAGVTKAGKRCTRKVKGGPALASYEMDEGEPNLARFCHQHSKELMGPSGYYARKNGEWVEFEGEFFEAFLSSWIPPYLQAETQVSLRVEMEKSRSQSDVPGYIYTFEIRDPDSTTIKLKVGRAVNLVKRIDQWGKQCGSKEQVLRGFYPGSVEPDEDGHEGSLMKGRVRAGEKGAWCHRLERLIHLELADLVSTAVYLDPQWPNVSSAPSLPSPSTGSPPMQRTPSSNGPCKDCGSMHKEIFEFERWKRGRNVGREWEVLVKPVVERWGRFVELYL
ncbi:hypothetical protein BJ165DRAFT_1413440 [Panaeolus papilionaceus]|nr:hypothetical protein BJ165DRAFT_1413440 [Panaeolus papilionaceus]